VKVRATDSELSDLRAIPLQISPQTYDAYAQAQIQKMREFEKNKFDRSPHSQIKTFCSLRFAPRFELVNFCVERAYK